MTVHIFVEGPSERVFLERWATRVLKGVAVRVHPHQGKGSLPSDLSAKPDPKRRGLLDQLPAALRGLAAAKPQPSVIVLVDADDDECEQLAESIRQAASAVAPALNVVVRIAVEETEAFYLGDLAALEKAYPDADMKAARAYVPDSICGTWELFGQVIGDGGGNKVAWAEAMGPRLTVQARKSRSPSFRALVHALKKVGTSLPTPAAKRGRQYRHTARPKNDPSRRR